MAQYTVNVTAYENQPPSSVGDGSSTIDYGETLVYTRAMLTSALSPAYSDPEGDPADKLKIITLPGKGKLKLNGVDVIINQIIDFTDIDNSLLTYVPDNGTTASYSPTFEFQIADTGSGIFVG